MSVQMLATLATGSATDEASVEMTVTPFLIGREVEAYIAPSADMAGNDAVIVIQSSPDDSDWTTLLTMTGLGPTAGNIILNKHMRVGVTTAADGTDGEYSAWLRAGD